MPDPREIIFGRLDALRLELMKRHPEEGFHSEGKFAATVGIDKTSYSLIKKLERDLPLAAAFRIREKWGVSLDWLYYGDQPEGVQLMAKIGRGPVSETPPQKKRKAG